MATRIYSTDLGDNLTQVTDGVGSATTKGIELTVDLAKILTREDLLIALERFEDYLIQNIWPPA